MPEFAHSFGPAGALIGVLTQPEPGHPAQPAQVGCLLPNTGINPRIGPRRVNVKLARRLAPLGISSLRFDLSGIGDSLASVEKLDFRQQAMADMKAALDFFEAQTGLSRFMVFGVCSGAVNAWELTLADHRIVGMCTFDGYAFPTFMVRVERKLRRWAAFPFNPTLRHSYPAWHDAVQWLRAPFDAHARRKALAHWRNGPGGTGDAPPDIFETDSPVYEPERFAADMQAALERRVDMYLMHSAMVNMADRDRKLMATFRGQPWLDRIRYRFWPKADHTMTLLEAQQEVLCEVAAWAAEVARTHAGHPSAPPPTEHLQPASADERRRA